MPDRLPSLVLLLGFWVPSVIAGRAAADLVRRRGQPTVVYSALALFVVASSVAWYFINLSAVPPYIPGATMDPTYLPPGAPAALATLTAALVLPVSAIACAVAFRFRSRALTRPDARHHPQTR